MKCGKILEKKIVLITWAVFSAEGDDVRKKKKKFLRGKVLFLT
jgi:hypothetical protein